MSPFLASFFLFVGIGLIILLTVKIRVHAFFSLIIACFVVGLGLELSFGQVMGAVRDGFGNILKSLGLIIVFGTFLGVLLEETGSTRVMASVILRITGEKRPALAMGITGFVVGLPVFCDSGYIVLNGLARSMAKKTGKSPAVISVSLAMGLYVVHCLVPPHPGIIAATGTIGADLGKQMIAGIAVAAPVFFIGYTWALYSGKKFKNLVAEESLFNSTKPVHAWNAFLPTLVPVFLIGLRSVLMIYLPKENGIRQVSEICGEPALALAIGIAWCLVANRSWKRGKISSWMSESVEKAGSILVIIGAGGSFGAILSAAKIGDLFSHANSLQHLGMLFPFLLTALLKTALGSSTVAIITASSILQPLLPAIGLDSDGGRMICVLAMGSGSMMVSHANDAYFWVVSKFTPLDMRPMLAVYSMATFLMGTGALVLTYFLSLFVL